MLCKAENTTSLLIAALLVAGCATATPQIDETPAIVIVEVEQVATAAPAAAAPDLSQVLPEQIAPGWPLLFETAIDPQALGDIEPPPAPVVGGHVRAWRADDRLLWAVVFQFVDAEGATQAYDVVTAGLRNDVQPEELGDESVSSTSPLGLAVYVLHRGSYLFNAGSAIMDDPQTPPPDVSLLRQLAEESDGRMQRSQQGAPARDLVSPRPPDTSTLTASSRTGFDKPVPVKQVALGGESVPHGQRAPAASVAATATDIVIPLVSSKLGKNGAITITVTTILQGKTDNRCKYRAEVYIARIEIGKDDGDDWIRGDGDIFAGGEVSTVCPTVGFVSPLLANLGPGQAQDLTGGGQSSGVFAGSRECEADCSETFTYSAVVVVRDSDDDDALDKAKCILNIASIVLGGKLEREAAGEAAKGIEQVRQTKHQARTDPSSRITDAENVLGDEIGRGNQSGEGLLPLQSVSTARPVRDDPPGWYMHRQGRFAPAF